jgi:hypothetical protein
MAGSINPYAGKPIDVVRLVDDVRAIPTMRFVADAAGDPQK